MAAARTHGRAREFYRALSDRCNKLAGRFCVLHLVKRKRRRKSNAVSEISKGESMNSKFTFMVLGVVALVLLIGAGLAFANINYTQEGTVKVVTYFGRIERVYRPD